MRPTPNQGMEPTSSSIRSCLAPASRRSSCPAMYGYHLEREDIQAALHDAADLARHRGRAL